MYSLVVVAIDFTKTRRLKIKTQPVQQYTLSSHKKLLDLVVPEGRELKMPFPQEVAVLKIVANN